MVYITRSKSGLIQLWNNKPKYNKKVDCYYAWIDRENNKNEIAIEVNNNDYIRKLFGTMDNNCCFKVDIIIKKLIK